MRVPLVDLAAQEAAIADDVLAAVGEVAREAKFVLGSRVETFERWLAGACGVSSAVGVASGTDAIELALRALDVGPGDAVVTPALSFVAAAEAITATGARPVFCDVEPATMNAGARTFGAAIARARAEGLRVRAIVPVHLFGLCAPMGELVELARREGLAVVEDAAQALGARDVDGRAAGASGDCGCFSFFPTKNLGAWGDAGAVVTSDGALAARLRRLRAHGAVSMYVHAEAGRNSRLDALQAAVLLVKARRLPDWHAGRERLACGYLRGLAPLPVVLPSAPAPPARHAWQSFVVRVPSGRDELATWLRARGIETRLYYPVPLHRQPVFAGLGEPDLPVAEDACRTALALPLFTTMSEEQQRWVVDAIAAFFDRGRGRSG
ncbi:MAG TPA: DegT/DnrJ/EryC1/StrS family aminotransferase [Polyangiaceae bacterium]|nr:DegT/DnrJ/EryC1/StrS family aminotransferase [Polyangiaceae bacterium]